MPYTEDQHLRLDSAAGNPIRNSQVDKLPQPAASEKIERGLSFSQTLRAKSHPRYNCHGLTFASRRAAVTEDEDVMRILEADDGYRRITPDLVLPGDIVVYFEDGRPEHSGIVVTAPDHLLKVPKIVSKWGCQGPEVLHSLNECTYPMADIRFYRVQP